MSEKERWAIIFIRLSQVLEISKFLYTKPANRSFINLRNFILPSKVATSEFKNRLNLLYIFNYIYMIFKILDLKIVLASTYR